MNLSSEFARQSRKHSGRHEQPDQFFPGMEKLKNQGRIKGETPSPVSVIRWHERGGADHALSPSTTLYATGWQAALGRCENVQPCFALESAIQRLTTTYARKSNFRPSRSSGRSRYSDTRPRKVSSGGALRDPTNHVPFPSAAVGTR